MNQLNPTLEFHWGSSLGISVILFLFSGVLHLLIGVVTPFAVDSEFSRKILMISNRPDTAFFGTAPSQLIQKIPELAKLRAVLSPVVGGWLITIGIFTLAVTWFGLRNFQLWSLITLGICGAVLTLFWIITMRVYFRAGIEIQFSDLPPIFWIPAVSLIPALILGWIGLK